MKNIDFADQAPQTITEEQAREECRRATWCVRDLDVLKAEIVKHGDRLPNPNRNVATLSKKDGVVRKLVILRFGKDRFLYYIQTRTEP